MATFEKLQEFVKVAKAKLEEVTKGQGGSRFHPAVIKQRKKVKRLSRKVAKITYKEKKLQEKKKKQKGEAA